MRYRAAPQRSAPHRIRRERTFADRSADVAGAVDGALERGGDRVGVGDDGDVGGLVVELGAAAHRPRRMQAPHDAARLDAERRLAALRVGVVELLEVEPTARAERVLAQQELRPRPNLAPACNRDRPTRRLLSVVIY